MFLNSLRLGCSVAGWCTEFRFLRFNGIVTGAFLAWFHTHRGPFPWAVGSVCRVIVAAIAFVG
ncbi:hypothetical protein HOY80DRAFT_948976 [Tuber brumale]|nr:hypothetical protein HOY80DRAFT_948976 [Tuber brumale]